MTVIQTNIASRVSKLFLLICVFLILFLQLNAQEVQKIEDLKALCSQANHDTVQVDILLQIGNLYLKSFPDTTRYYCEQATIIQSKWVNEGVNIPLLRKSFFEVKTKVIIGASYTEQQNFHEAIRLFKEAEEQLEIINDNSLSALYFNHYGDLHYKQGKHEKSLEILQKALKLAESVGNQSIFCQILGNIGNLHAELKNMSKAIEYYERAIEIEEKHNYKDFQARHLNNMGIVYMDMKDYEKAIEVNMRALQLHKELNDIASSTASYHNLGRINVEQEKYDEALKYFKLSLEIAQQIDYRLGIGYNLSDIARVYNKKKEYEKALDFAEKGLKVAVEFGHLMMLINAYENIFETYQGLGNYPSALYYHIHFNNLKDSLFNQDKNKAIAEMESKYEFEFNQHETEKKDILIAKQEAVNKKDRVLRNAFIAGFFFVIILLIVVIYNLRQKKNANLQLALQKMEIQKKNEELSQQKEEIIFQANNLTKVNTELEKLSIVASETDNSIIIADKDGKIEWTNDGFTKLFGYTTEEYISNYGERLQDINQNPDIQKAISRCITKKVSTIFISHNRTRKGKTIWTQSTLTPILNDQGEITRIIAIDSDISKIKKAEEEIKSMNVAINTINKQMIDSISYAKLIQEAILPSLSHFKKFFSESFIFFRPKDIVSGDFYWFAEVNDKIFIAVVDCTGHGVPGALMSMIGNTLLNETVKEKNISLPSSILKELNKGVIQSLRQGSAGESSLDDGMEITLICYQKERKEVQVSGAGQTFVYIQNGTTETVSGSLFPIGGVLTKHRQVSFTDHSFSITPDLRMYLFSDGIQDQFSEAGNQKFMLPQLIKLLEDNHQLPMKEQHQILATTFDNWKGDRRQIDDVLMIGIKV